uniref:CBM20 domain-containing protein n=1 Tax=Chromera velia CCMP2878 TaxID=1169474 RepID=A0A0G4G4Z1_9ALVE|eukprot:Cvel_4173.t1-p1 / transcript=Cvel_4173.t1 / gene=Cvel_4173 / organism=Chromera_velia_CCMP2878 / gene_product=Zinc finger protein 331, putative / transcript_product=Zinc finger protein 331, putative / location=Cvel_scaffold180:6482-8181(+) / protein_length=548 / sequence_SO=supercontig / SO=protein_coding / is_pseudo=false
MNGLIAFIAHCPEVQENQRVVVVGECPELGGWELGGALSLTPAPCGRPWWASSEVRVNLSASQMGVSGGVATDGRTGGDGEGVVVSELKFRLVAIPNDSDVDKLPDSHEVVCLEGLKGGDFRVVRLVAGGFAAECFSVGERGERCENTICVSEEVGGEGEDMEVVGISVEWGVPESVQLALLPHYTNRQAEHLQRQREHPGLSAHPSQPMIACSMSSEMTQAALQMINSKSQDSPSAGHRRLSNADGLMVRGEGVRARAQVSQWEFATVPLMPSTRDRTRDPQSEERLCERPRGFAAPLKRRRSEVALTQVRGDECDEVCGLDGERSGGASGELESEGGCVREEKRRCLTVSLPSSASLSSESCRGREDPVAGRRAIVSAENGRRGGEGGEVKRDRRGNILCLHGRVRSRCKECGGARVCEHGRERYRCKFCGGSSICKHGRRRYKCKDCGGSSFCEHGRIRSVCKECGGASICEHSRERHYCKDCGGASICEHGRQRPKCKECGGSSFCGHGRERYYCKDCGGNGICVHKRRRYGCKECKLVSSLSL